MQLGPSLLSHEYSTTFNLELLVSEIVVPIQHIICYLLVFNTKIYCNLGQEQWVLETGYDSINQITSRLNICKVHKFVLVNHPFIIKTVYTTTTNTYPV